MKPGGTQWRVSSFPWRWCRRPRLDHRRRHTPAERCWAASQILRFHLTCIHHRQQGTCRSLPWSLWGITCQTVCLGGTQPSEIALVQVAKMQNAWCAKCIRLDTYSPSLPERYKRSKQPENTESQVSACMSWICRHPGISRTVQNVQLPLGWTL